MKIFYTLKQLKMKINILKWESDSIPYRPQIAKEIWVIPAIILQQMIYRYNWTKFYKFLEPSQNDKYITWDSWIEELRLSKFEFTNWLKKIWFKLWKSENIITKEEALIIYYTDNNRITRYDLNIDNIENLLNKCYNSIYLVNKETWFTKENKETWFIINNEHYNNNTNNILSSNEDNNNVQSVCSNNINKEERYCNNKDIIDNSNIDVVVKEQKKEKRKRDEIENRDEVFENLWKWYGSQNTKPQDKKAKAKEYFNRYIKTNYDLNLLRYSLPIYIKSVNDKQYLVLLRTYLSDKMYLDHEIEYKKTLSVNSIQVKNTDTSELKNDPEMKVYKRNYDTSLDEIDSSQLRDDPNMVVKKRTYYN